MAGIGDDLTRLAQLREAGVLTDEEFAEQKARLLAGEATASTETPAPSKSKSSLGKGCLIALAVIIGLAILLTMIGGSQSDTAAAPEDAAAAATPPVEVTANELFTAYQANEAAAQERYGNRRLLVSGTVDGVSLDFTDEPVVQLRTSNQFMQANARLTDASKPRASTLAKGNRVRLLCASVGEVMGSPQLADCDIQ